MVRVQSRLGSDGNVNISVNDAFYFMRKKSVVLSQPGDYAILATVESLMPATSRARLPQYPAMTVSRQAQLSS